MTCSRILGPRLDLQHRWARSSFLPFGRRLSKSIDLLGDTTIDSATQYLWSGDELTGEYGPTARAVRYEYAGGWAPVRVAYGAQGAETVYDVHVDHLGTPRMLTDSAEAVAWRGYYAAYGEAALDSGNSVTFNIRFPGQYYDEETGLHYNRFRYYDPGVGRYVSADPIGQFGILERAGIFRRDLFGAEGVEDPADFEPFQNSLIESNLYSYVVNHPINLVDPLGLNTIGARIAVLTAQGNARGLQGLIATGILSPGQMARAQAALARLNSTAQQIISKECKGGINSQFPGQFRDSTLAQITAAARQGDRFARKALKLLNDGRFKK